MRNGIVVWMAMAVSVSANSAEPECTVTSDVDAAAGPIDMAVQSDADLLISMSMLTKLMRIDYAGASRKKLSCDLGPFDASGTTYHLFADDNGGKQRMAKPAQRGDPIAQVVPVTNIMKAVEAAKQGKSAAVEGYLLATVSKAEFTGWRYYTGMPDPAILKRDMAEALEGRSKPIFRNDKDGKTAIFLP